MRAHHAPARRGHFCGLIPARRTYSGGPAMKVLSILLLLVVLAIAGAAILIYRGWFEIAADVPHSIIVFNLMETARNRAITVRAKNIDVPALDKPKLIAKGARDYSEMCTGCHLAPGNKESELRDGLYPQPPDLTQRVKATPAEMFWVIKHGIKMSAMPAWGVTHDDARIWDMVAFIKKLPDLTPAQYQALVGASDESEREGGAEMKIDRQPKAKAHGHHEHSHAKPEK